MMQCKMTEVKEARGKTVARMTVINDFNDRDIELEFTDGTFLYLGMTPKIDVVTRLEKKVLRSA